MAENEQTPEQQPEKKSFWGKLNPFGNWMDYVPINDLLSNFKKNAPALLDEFAKDYAGDIIAKEGEEKAIIVRRAINGKGEKIVAASVVILSKETGQILRAERHYDVQKEIKGFDLKKYL